MASTAEPRTFTQEQVNGFLTRETKPLKARIAELESQAADHERVRGELTRAAEALTGERDSARAELAQARQQHAGAVASLRASNVNMQLQQALLSARALPSAVDVAVREMSRTAEIDTDDTGAITSIKFGGESFDNSAAAARKWLEGRLYFVAPPPKGGGTRSPGGTPGSSYVGDPAGDLSATEMMAAGWERQS